MSRSIPSRASSKVLAARAYYLLTRDRIDEAQVVLDQARFRAAPTPRVDMLYNMANARLRLVFDAIEQGQLDKATSLIGLAKDEYVDALRLIRTAWNVKFNLDVTSRLLRDLPEGQGPEDSPREAPKELWTDIPGTPKRRAMIRARLNDPRAWLLALAFALVMAALFVPRIDLTRSAYDVVAIVDVTGSMNVRDLARRQAHEQARLHQGAFAGMRVLGRFERNHAQHRARHCCQRKRLQDVPS